MQERFFTALREGMDAYDLDGDKIGSVGKVYTRSAAAGSTAVADSCFKVDTGFLGLGKDLFVPISAIRDVTGDRVILNLDKDLVDTMGWDHRPDWIPD